MAKLSRQLRRKLERSGKAEQVSYELKEQEIEALRTEILTGVEAVIIHTLRKRFKFGDTRLKQFVKTFDTVQKETCNGLWLKEGVSFEIFRSALARGNLQGRIDELKTQLTESVE